MLRVLTKPFVFEPTELKLTCNEYGYFIDKKTKMRTFGKLGVRQVQEFINSCVDSCDYSQIMSALLPSVSEFDDFSDVLQVASDISDPNDALAYASLLQTQFLNLPLEVKNHYGNNYEVFARDVIDGGFADYVASQFGPKQGVEDTTDNPDASGVGVKKDPGEGQSGVLDTVGQLRNEIAELRKKLDGGFEE